MQKRLEVYYADLSDKAKSRVLEYYDISKPSEGNLDITPLFVSTRYASNSEPVKISNSRIGKYEC